MPLSCEQCNLHLLQLGNKENNKKIIIFIFWLHIPNISHAVT